MKAEMGMSEARHGIGVVATGRLAGRSIRAGSCCEVCGSAQVDCDQVSEGGTLNLAQCRRCEHRWTWRSVLATSEQAAPSLPLAVPARSLSRAGREGADARQVASAA